MDRIKELLEFEGVRATDEQIRSVIHSRKLNVNDLTDDQVVQIVSDLKGGLTIVEPNKPSVPSKGGKQNKKGRTKQLKNEVDQNGFNESITHLAHVAKAEIDTVTNTLREGSEAWKEQTKQDWKEIILNTPVDAMNEMLEEAREEAADIDSFRTAAQSAIKNIFPLRTAS